MDIGIITKTATTKQKKYSTRKEFQQKCGRAYYFARINKWLDDYTWFIHPEVSNKKWNKETCYNEAKKYSKWVDFQEKYNVPRK